MRMPVNRSLVPSVARDEGPAVKEVLRGAVAPCALSNLWIIKSTQAAVLDDGYAIDRNGRIEINKIHVYRWLGPIRHHLLDVLRLLDEVHSIMNTAGRVRARWIDLVAGPLGIETATKLDQATIHQHLFKYIAVPGARSVHL